MKPKSYAAALGQVLEPMGFTREGKLWTRVRGDLWERVGLQVSQIAGVTANLSIKDLETERLLQEAIPSKGEPVVMIPITVRIGTLMDGYDHWWLRDPNGPSELAEAVRIHAAPFFDRVRTLEDQAAKWFGRGSTKGWRPPSKIYLAITLYRMGELEEACRALSRPPKHIVYGWLSQVESVRQWLGCS